MKDQNIYTKMLSRITNLEISVKNIGLEKRKNKRGFHFITLLIILDIVILIVNTVFDWRAHGWR